MSARVIRSYSPVTGVREARSASHDPSLDRRIMMRHRSTATASFPPLTLSPISRGRHGRIYPVVTVPISVVQ